jgi:hypothetical protein
LLDAKAQLKRAELEACPAPLSRERLRAEADDLEAQATRLRDPAMLGVPDLHWGRGGEVSPLPDRRMPIGLRDIAEAVQAQPNLIDAEASVDRLNL